jgi:hypothetical protein
VFLYFLLALILVLITFVFGLIIDLIGNLNCEKIEMFPELLKSLGLKTTFSDFMVLFFAGTRRCHSACFCKIYHCFCA